MREKKYANILDDYPEEIVEDIKEEIEVLDELEEDDTEVKLSMTRELKFKELHESEVEDIEVEEVVDTSELDLTLEKEVVSVDDVKEETAKIKTDEVKESTENLPVFEESKGKKKDKVSDELYLTSSFKPLRKRMGLGKVFKFLISLLLIVGIGFSLVFFLIIPIYNKFISSKPKAIFDNSINYVGEQIKIINDYVTIDSETFDVETIIDFDSSSDELKSIMDNKFGVRIVYDPETGKSETGYFVQNNDGEKYGYSHIADKDSLYYKFSTSETYLKSDEEEYMFDNGFVLDEFGRDLDNEEFNYYVDANVRILKSIITEDMLTSEKDEIDINNDSLDVVRNTLKLDKEGLELFEKKFNEKVLDDKKLLNIEATLYGLTLEEVKANYEEPSSYKNDYSLTVNLYTIKGNKFVGFDVEINGFRTIYYYVNEKGDFEAHFNLSLDEECFSGGDCLLENQVILDMFGVKKDGYTQVDLYLNDEDIGNLKVREIGYELIDLDYKLIVSDIVLEGTLKIDFNKKEEKFNIKFAFEFNEQYSSVDVTIKFNKNSNIGIVDENKVVPYTDKVFDEEYLLFETQLEEKNMLEAWEFLLSIFEETEDDSESNQFFDLDSFEVLM